MSLTTFQQTICRLIAANRKSRGESYVAGGAALNFLAGGRRISRDLDLFHDTPEALDATWQSDRRLLESRGYELRSVRERPSFVEALVCRGDDVLLMQWTRDSAYRFFPLVEHEQFGLVLHPFDLATNKILALVGRLEARDWIDLITCHDRIQHMALLAWAACGKDPGFTPLTILEQAARSGRYSAMEIAELSFDGEPPDIGNLSRKWRVMLEESRDIISSLPSEQAGRCVLDRAGYLYAGGPGQLENDLAVGDLSFHPGRIRGAYPEVVAR